MRLGKCHNEELGTHQMLFGGEYWEDIGVGGSIILK